MNKKIFFIVLGVGLVAVLAVALFYRGGVFSKQILKVEILGPLSSKLGEEIEYTLVYKNNGNFVLENPELVFKLPENSLAADGKLLISKRLEDIYPGDQESIKFKARLMGKDGDVKIARATISYVPKNITATYESDTSFLTKLDGSSLTLDFDLPTRAEYGKELQYSINYFSNIDSPLENLSIKVDPTSGFEFLSSTPSSLDNSEWKLQTLDKAQGGRINIKGKVLAPADQVMDFSAQIGIRQGGSFVVLREVKKEVLVIQPLLSISQQVNGAGSYVASPGERLHYKIFFRNIGNTPFEDMFIIVKLDGLALDMSSIEAGGAQVQAGAGMIVWDNKQISQLKYLDVQQEGEVDFFVKVKKDWTAGGSENAVIANEVNISQIVQKFSIKINSGMVISQGVFYKDSEIINSGPIPPKVGGTTTYTVKWQIQNYLSDAKNVKVKAVLPANVILTGKVMPQDEISNFSFDSASRELVWSAGDILAGTGVSGDPVVFSFQISLNPLSSQKGSAAPLIGKATITGENQFTNTIISASDMGVDSRLPDDFVNSGGGIIE